MTDLLKLHSTQGELLRVWIDPDGRLGVWPGSSAPMAFHQADAASLLALVTRWAGLPHLGWPGNDELSISLLPNVATIDGGCAFDPVAEDIQVLRLKPDLRVVGESDDA